MGDGYTVKPDELRAHAAKLEALRDRFAAVKSASTHITQDSQAYGLLCGWIAAVLEGRHRRQDELVAYVEENLSLAARSLRDSADDYEDSDGGAATVMGEIEGELTGRGAPR
ncbi:type VII secretion target [Actinophytocola sp.]|uniref:type VII secretion target n=1 Tax=Actinophytocola sp. TaxID=1872138 RepID=UPI002ED1A550